MDEPSRYGFGSAKGVVRGMAGHAIKRHDLKALCWCLGHASTVAQLHPVDPVNTFDWIKNASECHGLVSTSSVAAPPPSKDADYEPEHPANRKLMRRIHSSGHEVGLHRGHNTYQTLEAIIAEAKRYASFAKRTTTNI